MKLWQMLLERQFEWTVHESSNENHVYHLLDEIDVVSITQKRYETII